MVDLAIREPDTLVLTVSDTGYGRLSEWDDYRIQSRGGKGLTNYHVEKFGNVAATCAVPLTEDILLVSSQGIVIRLHVDDIRQCRRPSKGVRVMHLTDDAKVLSLVRTARADDAEEEVAKPDAPDADAEDAEAPAEE